MFVVNVRFDMIWPGVKILRAVLRHAQGDQESVSPMSEADKSPRPKNSCLLVNLL